MGKPDAGAREHRVDGPVEAIGDDGDVVSALTAKVDKAWKTWIYFNSSHKCVILRRRCAHQVDLAHETFAGADTAGLPLVLDSLPARICKLFK